LTAIGAEVVPGEIFEERLAPMITSAHARILLFLRRIVVRIGRRERAVIKLELQRASTRC